MVQLCLYQEQYYEELMKFELPEEQKAFTGMPQETLKLALEDPDRYPVVVLHEEKAAGFFVLHLHSELAGWVGRPKAVLLRALCMNHKHQGRGYAKQAMLALPDFVKGLFPEADEIVLAVNEKNTVGRQLYSRTGYVDRDYRNSGRSGLQLILHLILQP